MYVRILLFAICLSLTLELCIAMIAKRMPMALPQFDACIHGCKCYASQTQRTDPHSMYNVQNKQNERFMVNCDHSDLNWFYQYNIDFVHIVNGLPDNTTDLIISNFPSLEIAMVTLLPMLHPHLITFTVNKCRFVDLRSNAFQSALFYPIKSIEIHSNLMKSESVLERGTFDVLPSTEIIIVVRNIFLKVVQTGAFRALPQAKIINLTGNSIEKIQPGAFHNLPLLTTLDLSYNYLGNIPGEDIINLSRFSLKFLRLEGNRWNCSCEIGWILILNRSILANSGWAVCYHPLALNGTTLQQLTQTHFQHCCIVDFKFKWCLNLLIVSSSVGVCMCILWKKCHVILRIGRQFEFMEPLASNVYKAKLKDGRFVAIKRVPRLSTQQSKEIQILLHMSKFNPPHPNVIHYLMKEDDNEATYIVLELCKGNLRDLVVDASSRNDEDIICQLTCGDCLQQISQGLCHLHSCNVEHRDIKPTNILWNIDKSSRFRFIISDFDLGHFTGVQSSHKIKYGSTGWTAPELWTRGKRTSAVDIFSLGCVFFYVLTLGGHPFTLQKTSIEEVDESIAEEWQNNIENNQFSLEGLTEHHDKFKAELAQDLIGSMIQACASKRPTAQDVLQHPLFWDTKKQKDFFHLMGNFMDNKKGARCLVEHLEQKSVNVFQGSWMDALDPAVRRDVKGFKEQKEQVCGLLRVIRNKTEHFQKLGQELKGIYGGSPEGVVSYYNSKFPKLLIYTFKIWHQLKNDGLYT